MIRKYADLVETMDDFVKVMTAIEVVVRRDGMRVLYVAEIDDAIEIVDCLIGVYNAEIDFSEIWQKDGTLKIIIM